MKIQQIKMKNLASLEGEQVIDFRLEPLKDCGLFSIVGPTGSGKSTCLDAVVLSLYGTSPRYHDAMTYAVYNGQKTNNDQNLPPTDPRNILREGCRDCMAQLLFIGDDGNQYQATWSVELKRGGKTYAKPLHKLENLTHPKEISAVQNSFSLTGGWLSEDYKVLQKEIIRAVGLDYDQFTRTVMLAQNSFANFLQSDGPTKGRLLEKLTGTEIYTRIGLSIYSFYKEAFDAKNALEREIEGIRIGLLEEDKLVELKNRQCEQSDQITNVSQELEALKKKRNWYVQLLLLTEKEAQSQLQVAQCQTAYADNENARNRLLRHDSVQGVNELFFALNKWTWEGKDLERKIAENQLLLSEQATIVEAILKEKETIVANRERAEKTLETLTPELKKYRDLKVQASALQESCQTLKHELVSAQKKADEAARFADTKSVELAKTSLLKETAKETLRQLESHREMIVSIPALVIQMDQLGKDTDQCTDRKKKLAQEMNERQPLLQKAWDELTLKKEQLATEVQHWKVCWTKEQTYFSTVSLGKLQVDLASLEANISLFKEAESWWKNLTDALQAQRKLTLQRTDLYTLVTEESQSIARLQRQYDEKNAVYQGNKQMYTLVMGKDLNTLRSQLVEGERCPVCGSAQHPYSEKDHRPSPLLVEMKVQLDQVETETNELNRQLEAEKQLYNKHIGLSEANAREEEKQKKTFESLHQQWSVYRDCVGDEISFESTQEAILTDFTTQDITLADYTTQDTTLANHAIRIKEGLQQVKAAAEILRAKQVEYNTHRKETDALQQQKEALDQRLKSVEEQENKIQIQRAESTSKITHLQNEIESLRNNRQLLINEISACITLPDWLNLWTVDRKTLRENLEAIFRNYNEADRLLQVAQSDVVRFQSELEILQKDYEEKKAAVVQRTEAAQKGETDWQAKQAELKAVFAGDTADDREKQANQGLTESKQAEKTLITRLAEQQSRLDGLRGEQEQLGKSQTQVDDNKRTTQAGFDQWMADYAKTYTPLSIDELTELLSTETNWEALRRNDNFLKEKLDVAAGTFKADQANGAEHQKNKPSESEETLRQLQQEQETRYEQMNKELIAIGGELTAHINAEKNMTAYRERLNQLTQTYSDWRELNKIFGTTDGKGISEKAQCITLSYLIEHANVQLRQLTRRYSISQVPDSLGLKIIDHDRGDESRAISTLSGGETFLISLSLALGLSSLSSENIQIGTMFIDEGFGTLDAHSLSIVIDALSRLQSSQGRQVGVISHTEEMKNTIPTRISIQRESVGGRSFIKVEDGFAVLN